jgi:hypothetical protein
VDATWLDPSVGPVLQRHGVHSALNADLFLPDGHVIPPGGSIQLFMDFAINAAGSGPPSYALLLGTTPGSTPIGGINLPLNLEPLVLASLLGQLGPYLLNSPGTAVAQTLPCIGYCGPSAGVVGHSTAAGIILVHPGAPALSGLPIYVAGMAYSQGVLWAATQLEQIIIG